MYRLLLFCLLGLLPFTSRALTVTATVTPTACTPCNGSITATASAGTAPYQYSIDGGVTWQSSGLFSGLCAATYTITAIDAALVTATVTATVVQNPPLTWSASGVNCTAYNLCNGQINVTISGGIPPYTIRRQWGANTQYHSSSPITNLCPGTYTITVIDASNNCGFGYTNPVVITIGVGPPHGPGNLYCTTSYGVGSCNQICDNTFTASGVGGTPPYMYSLNGGPYQSSGTFPSQCEGPNTYTVCVRDAVMNTWCVQAYYPTNPTYMRWPPTVTASGCPCSGSIVFSPAGNPGEQFWLIQNNVTIATNTTGSFTGLCPGYYTVSSMYNGCGLTYPVQIVPGNPTFSVTVTTTSPVCYNSCSGAITCTPSPWSATGYQYSKDNGVTWQTSNTFTNLCPATYTILVRDSVNCYGSYTQTIANPAQVPLTLSVSQPNCANGNCLGGIICTPTTGPTAPYQWSNDGGVTWQASNQFMNLCAGSQTITVRDANGCTRALSTSLSSTLQQYYLGYTRTHPTCVNPCGGVINLTLGSTNAPAGYNQYSIDSGVTWQSGTGFSNLCAGTYYARARNTLSGCYSPAITIVLNQPVLMTLSATSPQAACPSSCNGTIQATVNTGTNPPYQYSIDGGITWQSSASFSNVCAGTYTVTVKNSINCTGTQTVVVSTAPSVTASAAGSDPVCNGDCNGAVTISASSTPAQSFQYSIDGGATWYTSNTFAGLCAGTVNVQVKDSFNCITNTAVVLTNPPPLTASISATPPLCSDVCNGNIVLNPSQPAGYTYSIDSGVTWQSTTSYTGLCAGQYTVVIQDASGCSFDSTFTFIAPPPITASTMVTSISCANMCDGEITLTASPSGTYAYSLDSGLTWQSGNAFTNLCAGTYNFMVRDSNLCSAYGTEILNAPLPVVATVSSQVNVTCNNDCNGSVMLGVSPLGTYQFSIDSALTWQSGSTFMGLCAGNYSVIAENPAGCRDTINAVITEPADIVTTYSVTHVQCAGSYGLVQLQSTATGEMYSIDFGNTWQSDSTFTNLPAGNYSVLVMSVNGCMDTVNFTIMNSSSLVIQLSTTAAICGQCNGSVQVNLSGGNPPYTYSVSPGNSTTNLCAGVYSVFATDANGCSDSVNFAINNTPPLFQIDSVGTQPAVMNQNNGCAQVYITGSSGPYVIQWDSAAAFQTTDTACGLAPGTYCVTVTDTNGCTVVSCGTVGVITDVDGIALHYDIFPNPASSSFTITGASSTMHVVLYDLQGRVIVDYGNTVMYEDGTTFDLPGNIATGNYVVEMVYGDVVVREKLVVER